MIIDVMQVVVIRYASNMSSTELVISRSFKVVQYVGGEMGELQSRHFGGRGGRVQHYGSQLAKAVTQPGGAGLEAPVPFPRWQEPGCRVACCVRQSLLPEELEMLLGLLGQ